ncbi:MAG: hypothetical protein ACLR7U_09370, partial [Ruthenibacterium lactatiformans]
ARGGLWCSLPWPFPPCHRKFTKKSTDAVQCVYFSTQICTMMIAVFCDSYYNEIIENNQHRVY